VFFTSILRGIDKRLDNFSEQAVDRELFDVTIEPFKSCDEKAEQITSIGKIDPPERICDQVVIINPPGAVPPTARPLCITDRSHAPSTPIATRKGEYQFVSPDLHLNGAEPASPRR
jgi:hypothetical protein